MRAVPGGQEAPHPAAGACLAALAPAQRLAGLLSLAFVEDYAVLDARDTTLPWLAVCLPSHWAPEDKLGRPFAEVHAPVADNRLLVGAAGALARLVAGPQRWERFVWTLTPVPSCSRSRGCAPSTRASCRCRRPGSRCSRSRWNAGRSPPGWPVTAPRGAVGCATRSRA
ncbi:heme-dependent oxidative N-demethylase subunit alpha family protein [Piscinibacter sakaiensis]|uniref:heme-dependent oxidative N-demethylase subunit alpha family protein n=1 Tax=Piscinibacter sakaiensis TaxID=1547922 RepID=UPI0037290494